MSSDDYQEDLGKISIDDENIICLIKGKGDLRYKAEAIRLFIDGNEFSPDCTLIGIDDENKDSIEVELLDRVIIISGDNLD